jgi:predicted aldo/keto reductase-like oxidoreductase
MKRREFIGTMAASATWLASGKAWPQDDTGLPEPASTLPKRPLGKTGLNLSVIGFSGIVARGNTPEGVDRAVGVSRDLGINYFDTAASYGNSEEMLSPAIQPHRKDIILATKTRERTREGAEAEFNRSCQLLKTDYFDMFLVHGIQHVDRDVDPAFAAGGAMEYLLEKKKAEQIRFLGFSAHSTEAALLAMDRYDFDFFYFPVSYVSFYTGSFGPEVLAKAQEKGVPCVSLKAMARQHWPADFPKEQRCDGCWYEPIDDPAEGSLALRWALSQGVASILPPGNEMLYRQTLALSGNLAPITESETDQLQLMAADKIPLFPR